MLVYGAVDPRNGHLVYVGKTARTLDVRKLEHEKSKKNYSFHRFIRNLGRTGAEPEWFVIEDGFESNEALREAESFYIAYYKSLGCSLLNQTTGGEGTPHTLETRAKMRNVALAQSRRPSQKCLERAIAALSKPCSPARRHKLSVANKGKVLSEEHKRKIGLAHKGKAITQQHRAAVSAANKKSIVDNNGVVYPSLSEAASKLGLSYGGVLKVLRGQRKQVRGYTFSYIEE